MVPEAKLHSKIPCAMPVIYSITSSQKASIFHPSDCATQKHPHCVLRKDMGPRTESAHTLPSAEGGDTFCFYTGRVPKLRSCDPIGPSPAPPRPPSRRLGGLWRRWN